MNPEKKNLLTKVTIPQYSECLVFSKKIKRHAKKKEIVAHSYGGKKETNKLSLNKHWTY